MTGKPVKLEFSSGHFDQMPTDFGLFKIAARTRMQSQSAASTIATSIKYQVLSDQTAFVGVVKQKDKASGEMKEFAIEFGKRVAVAVAEPAKPAFEDFNYAPPVQAQFYACSAIPSRGLKAPLRGIARKMSEDDEEEDCGAGFGLFDDIADEQAKGKTYE